MNLLSLVFIFSFNFGDLSPCLKIETIDLNSYIFYILGFSLSIGNASLREELNEKF